jgi:cyanophycin synthetase
LDLDLVTDRLLSGASFVWKLRRRLYHRTPAKRQVTARRARFYRDAWQEGADALGGTLREVDGQLLEVRCGGVTVRSRRNVTSLDDPLTVAVAEDKPLVHRLLAERDIPVPRHTLISANDLRGAWRFVSSLGAPCVVKPARGASGAIGITTGVESKAALARALAYAGAFDRDVLVEELVAGAIYRLLYFDGELLDAVRRDSPTVIGDGRSNVERLIAAENERRLAGGIETSQSLVKMDGELRSTLRRAHRDLRSVPAAGERVLLKSVVNDNRREDNVSATSRLCGAVVDAGAEAAATVGARLAGVDIITTDPALPLAEAGGVVIEVNAAPGFYYHYYKRDGRVPVATLILERLAGAAR